LKRQIVPETQEPGSSVSIVARRHDVNSNQLFKWRRELLPKAVVESGAMVPVAIAPALGGRDRRAIMGHLEAEAGRRVSPVEQHRARPHWPWSQTILGRHHAGPIAQRVQ
jgi:hypothetical protein